MKIYGSVILFPNNRENPIGLNFDTFYNLAFY